MSTKYPATCSLGHAAVVLKDDNELQTHITSEHAGADVSEVRKAVRSDAESQAKGIVAPILTNAYAKWGITRTSVSSIRPEDVSAPLELTMTDFLAFLSSFGNAQQPSVDPDVGAFAVEFFLYVLYTTASEDSSKAGMFKLRDKLSGDSAQIAWSSVFSSAIDHYQRQSLLFTPRKLMRLFEDLFWELWMDKEVKALDAVRAHGTKKSREFRLPGGRLPAAYVVVPQLFDEHLTPDEQRVRDLHMLTVEKVAVGNERATFKGFDQHGQHIARQANHAHLVRAQAGGLGVGHPERPADAGSKYLDMLYGGRNGFRRSSGASDD